MYRIREVDATDDEIAETIHYLNRQPDVFPEITDEELEKGFWWLAYYDREAIAFAGLMPSAQYREVGYFKRAAVDPEHRGNGLQIRLMRVRINKARKLGYSHIVSECTDTPFSANNFIKAGFKIYEPKWPWAFRNSIYWIKDLR
jgi:GNAT superfamily N-acetyltransferase